MHPTPAQPRTVLVVEDNPDDADLLRLASRELPSAIGFHFVLDGEQAIAYLKGEGPFGDRKAHPLPDLLLLDLWLPGIDGFEVLAWVRNHSQFKDLKVFVWTDSSLPEVIDRASRAGANRFIHKAVAFMRGGSAGLLSGISQAILP
jgi:two-component system response regulator